MNTKPIPTLPSQGELAEAKALAAVDRSIAAQFPLLAALRAENPTAGELAEQRHLVDPLDHVLEHLADERHPVSAPETKTPEQLAIELLTTCQFMRHGTADAERLLGQLRQDWAAEDRAEVDRLRAALKDAADQVAERDDEIAQLHCLRAELAALPAPVVETAWRDALGNVWPLGHFPAETEALVLKTNPTIQRTVRTSAWTEVTA